MVRDTYGWLLFDGIANMNQRSRNSQNRTNANSRNRNNRKRRGGPKNQNGQQKASANRSQRSGNRSPNKSRHKSKNYSTTTKYLNLLDQHLQMRRKYYEKFDRVPLQERKSLEKKFFNTIDQLRQFEEKLSDKQKEDLHKLTEYYPLDTTYSNNHQLTPEQTPVEIEGDFEDPHVNRVQAARPSFREDTEESEGDTEDYKRYKGLD